MDIDNIYIYQRHSAMFHGDAVNPRINHPQETWQNPRFLSTFMGDSWGFPFDPQLRRRFRTLPRLNRQRASQILDMPGITTEDRLFKSFQPPNFCWWNMVKSPQLLVKSSEIIEIWLSSACCSCFARAQCLWVLSSRRKQLRRPRFDLYGDLMRLEMTWKGSKHIYKTYGYGSIPINTIFRGMNIHLPAILMFTRGTRFWHTAIWECGLSASNSCYLLHLVRFTGHFQKANRCTSNTKWQVSEVTEVPAPAPAPEAIQLERLYSENFDQYQTIKNNINDLWTMFEKVSLSPLSVNWGCLNQLWTPETMRSIEKTWENDYIWLAIACL